MNTAIALTLYRRAGYSEQVLNALLECYGIDDTPVYLSQDWSMQHNDQCEAVRQVILDFQRRHRGKSEYSINNPKLGIDLNKLSVIPRAFKDGADYVIFLEDDHVPCRSAIQWFVEMGEKFQNDERIGFITGYNKQTEEEFRASTPDEIGIVGIDDGAAGFRPSGWATWRDRWGYFLPNDGEDYKRICGEQGLFDHFMHLRHGEKLYKHVNPETVGLDKPKWPGLLGPKISRVQLIGWQDAEHTPSESYWREHEYNEFWMGSL